MSDKTIRDYSTSPRVKIRIESLSDLVFGLALSIGSLELLARTPKSPSELATSVGLFAFSFFVVISIWIGFTRAMAVLPQETGGAIALNLLLLFCVALEPYLFFILQSNPPDASFLEWTSFGYALDVGAMFLILAGLAQLILKRPATKGEEPSLHPILAARVRLGMRFYILVGGIYVLSALPIFWSDTPIGRLRFTLWYSAFLFVFFGLFNRRRERRANVKS